MQIKKQLTSLELSKRLEALGVKQKSLFYFGLKGFSWLLLYEVYNGFVSETGNWHARDEFHTDFYSAFTVAELGEMLPHHIHLEGKNYQIEIWSGSDVKDVRFWSIGYNNYGNKSEFVMGANTEADARAKMLIYLLENKLINL